MNIEHHNSRLTNRCEVIITDTPPARTYVNHELIASLQDYWLTNGCPTTDEVDRQAERVKLNCKTVRV